MARRAEKALNPTGADARPSALDLYKQQWPDEPATSDQLDRAFKATADHEIAAVDKVLDKPAEQPTTNDHFDETPSNSKISQNAYNLILEFEISSQQVYEKKYRRPIWPGVQSGVTIGIGYDVGYATAAQLENDWKGLISDDMISALKSAINVKGVAGKGPCRTASGPGGCPLGRSDQGPFQYGDSALGKGGRKCGDQHRPAESRRPRRIGFPYLQSRGRGLLDQQAALCRDARDQAGHEGRKFWRDRFGDPRHEAAVADRSGLAPAARTRGQAIRARASALRRAAGLAMGLIHQAAVPLPRRGRSSTGSRRRSTPAGSRSRTRNSRTSCWGSAPVPG